MYALRIVLVASTALIGLVLSCIMDTDCPGGCCHTDNLHGAKCYQYQNESEPCHLPGHQVKVMLYPCGCMQGQTCDEIHFDPTLPDEVHQAEILLLGHGYGLCTSTPGSVFGRK
ncbi:hypothetical protein ACF0H5_003326 [Mactra antiquata]